MSAKLLILGAMGIIGCAGIDGGGSVSGTVQGKALEVKDALLGYTLQSDGGIQTRIYLTDRRDLCSVPGNLKNTTLLVLYLENPTEGTVDLASPATTGGARFLQSDSQCHYAVGPDPASAGQITLKSFISALGGNISGAFSLTFDDASGDHLTGSFDARHCDPIPNPGGVVDGGTCG